MKNQRLRLKFGRPGSGTSGFLAAALVWALAASPLTLVPTSARADELRLRADAPDRHVVVRGDTLWGIAGRFLADPWRWPEIWRMNRDEVKNPHWIYPGEVLVLDRSTNPPRLTRLPNTRLRDGRLPTLLVEPRVRVEATPQEAVPGIPPAAIEPFLSRPLVVDEGALAASPRVVAMEERRVVLGAGGKAYATGVTAAPGALYQIYRPGKPLNDPEVQAGPAAVLGHEAIYVGEARVTRAGTPATLEVVRSTQEVLLGDRLLPAPPDRFQVYMPHAPAGEVRGRVVSAYGGVAEAGRNALVTLNRGTRQGLEEGHVLALYRRGDTVKVASGEMASGEPLRLPDERYGLVFVFRVFEKVSYALVVQTNRPVQVADVVQNP